jgi:hypothetical protein
MDDLELPASRSKAFEALGNAVNVKPENRSENLLDLAAETGSLQSAR